MSYFVQYRCVSYRRGPDIYRSHRVTRGLNVFRTEIIGLSLVFLSRKREKSTDALRRRRFPSFLLGLVKLVLQPEVLWQTGKFSR